MQYLLTFIFTVITVLALWLSKAIVDACSTRNDDHELFENNNTALSMRHAGFLIAVGLALAGARNGLESSSFWHAIGQFSLDALVVLLLLTILHWFNDLVLLPEVNNDSAVFDQKNTAVGFIEMSSYISSGILLAAAFAGQGGGLTSAVVFFLLGQVILWIAFGLIRNTCGFNFAEEIKEKNMAVGVMLGGEQVALALILGASILGPFQSWGKDIGSFLLWAAIGLITLLVLRPVVDRLLMPGTDQKCELSRDNNVAAAGIAAGAYLAVGIIIAVSIL